MTAIAPTGNDGRYSRIYLSALEPTAEEVAEAADAGGPEPRSLVETVARLDRALTARDRQQAARLIRALRAGARGATEVPSWV
ncbi:hypothetical protein I6A60_01750 [Frankia sp. AgB1.9]|uniref:hypothetical protein n=1 Tax=unclassified Frankia TaxID=2632575 RepID=UPI00193285FD|nr:MULTISPECIES: hypothetical protein [unclassified Frankia]MBL7491331.1 hypothetical protein [Frankia sp. AgW1.1]MBL7546609.1 hypothetical protein [Frankia sp. AgB1.9]MBL7622405.1 hypothetical protein [Frankia sp. AgB1.8]